jgi:hypothetical protein
MHAVMIHADGRMSHTVDLHTVANDVRPLFRELLGNANLAEVETPRCDEFVLLVDESAQTKNLTLNMEASVLAGVNVLGDAILVRKAHLIGSIDVHEDELPEGHDDMSGTRTGRFGAYEAMGGKDIDGLQDLE